MSQLFTDVLKLCAQAGMVNVGLVALDSVKMAAHASSKANRSYEHIAAEVDEMMTKANRPTLPKTGCLATVAVMRCPHKLRERTGWNVSCRLNSGWKTRPPPSMSSGNDARPTADRPPKLARTLSGGRANTLTRTGC
jgi:hypothetical protein